jgi:hypothetical protein
VVVTLDVDGERFAIRRAGDGGTACDWLSGPDEGYGFGSGRTPNRPVGEHREHIRAFLAMINPDTGLPRGRLRAARNPPEPLPGTDIGMSASSNWHYRSVAAGA